MEGTFLDPDSSDALAKEWNLPELPEGVWEKTILVEGRRALF